MKHLLTTLCLLSLCVLLFGCSENTENIPLVQEQETIAKQNLPISDPGQQIEDHRINQCGYTTILKGILSKDFVFKNGIWIDLEYEPGMKTTKIVSGSNAYLANKRTHPYFSIGNRVIVCFPKDSDYPCYELIR